MTRPNGIITRLSVMHRLLIENRVQQPTKKCRRYMQHIPQPDIMQQKKERAGVLSHPLFYNPELLFLSSCMKEYHQRPKSICATFNASAAVRQKCICETFICFIHAS